MAQFKPRLEIPARTNKYFSSPNPFETSTTWSMWHNNGNCTAYAWGRFHEAMGGSVTDEKGYKLPTGNAGTWWGNVSGYKKGQTPKLGAVVCWGYGSSTAGHVAVVEQINKDGSIIVSQSGWQSLLFGTAKCTPPYYKEGGSQFQGFIYPNGVTGGTGYVDAPQLFINEAAKHIGPGGHAWVKSQVPIGNSAWCAATICAIAKVLGWSSILPTGPKDYASWAVCVGPGDYTLKRGGKRIDGPGYGFNVKPNPGDIVVFDWNPQYTSGSSSLKSRYIPNRDHVGIVEKVVGDVVHTIEGNTSSTYARRTYKYNNKVLLYYDRPDWSKVGGGYIDSTFGFYNPVYTTKSTRADALLRDVGYLSSKNEVATKKSNTSVSAINYTWVLGPLTEYFGGSSSFIGGDGDIDTTGITNTTARGVADYLAAKGLNRAAIAGVLGNIEAESGFRIDAVEKGPPYEGRGLCQWSYGRRERLYKRVPDWQRNLKGQLDLLWWELENEYNTKSRPVLKTLQEVPDTPQGCYDACKMFVMRFEVPNGYNEKWQWDRRYNRAKPYYDKMKIIPKVVESTNVTNAAKSALAATAAAAGIALSGKALKSTTIPVTVKQSGILSDYTYYPGINWKWNQGILFESWKAAGRTSKNNIATISGHYLVAVKPRFGEVGDVLKVTLEGGTVFSAVIGDVKGTDAQSDWGHVFGSGVSLIEWESVTNDQPKLNKSLSDLGFYGKKVLKIENFGKYNK